MTIDTYFLPARAPDPKTRWPQQAQTIVSVTIHIDGPCIEIGQGLPVAGIHSRSRYSMRRGIYRYIDMLERYGIPASFFACGQDVDLYPAPHRDILAAGHEIAAHGYQHEGWDLGDDEPALLEKTHRIIEDKLGMSPVGWCSPSGRKSAHTVPTLRRLGYIYDASEKDLDEPYLLAPALGQAPDFVTLPNNTVTLDDAPVYNMGQALPEEIYQNWVSEYEAISRHEGYIQLTVHPKAANGSGTPARARTVERFFAYLSKQPGVRFVTMRGLAEHCLKHPENWSTQMRTEKEAA